MTPPVSIILNPSSGAGNKPDAIKALLRENGLDAGIVEVAKGTDITGLAMRLLRDGSHTLVAGGGDGTVSSVAAAVVQTQALLGILPLGTLNHFAKDLKLPLNLAGAVRTLKTGTVRSVDVAEVNGRAFVNNSGLGLYASLVTQREKRRRLGQPKWIAFFWAAVATVRRFPFLYVRLAAGGQQLAIRTPFLFVGNNAYRMEGINLGSRDSLTEGKLCVGVTHHRIGRWGLVRLAFRALFGTIRSERDLVALFTTEVRIESRRKQLPVSLDGEVVLLGSPLHYRTRPGALHVIVPDVE
jgi:diacylglycerol kinase family enzyme